MLCLVDLPDQTNEECTNLPGCYVLLTGK